VTDLKMSDFTQGKREREKERKREMVTKKKLTKKNEFG
jgi:hypothetical protein